MHIGVHGGQTDVKSVTNLRAHWAAVASGAVLSLLIASTAAQATCNNPVGLPVGVGPGMLPGQFNNWGPAAICAAASTGTSITSSITTLDIAFLTQSSAFVSSPSKAFPDQPGAGFWARGVGGENTISSSGNAVGVPVGGGYATSSQSRLDFSGFQGGVDVGRFNIGASGINVTVGITGGVLNARAQELVGTGNDDFNVPFVGGYAVVTKGNFFADVLVKGDFYGIAATNANVGLANASFSGNAIGVTSSAGYKFDVGSYFVEPSVGLVWSHLTLDTVAVPGGGPTGVPAGVLSFSPVDSTVGRAGVRVGTAFQSGNLALQPFAAASVWNEFASDAQSAFVCNGCAFSLNIDTSRVGTFEQFGLGVAAQVLNTGWIGYARGDYRTGANIEGWDVTGGIRYQFDWQAPKSPMYTKAK